MKISDIIQDWNSLSWACFYGPGDSRIPDLQNAVITNIYVKDGRIVVEVNDKYMSHFSVDDEKLKQKYIETAKGKTLLESSNISVD
jgi:hypothetical protein